METKYPLACVLVTSDTCSKDPSKDESGKYVEARLKTSNLFKQIVREISSDSEEQITNKLLELINKDPALIITVGGTGLCPRDITPEATSVFYTKECRGIATALMLEGLKSQPLAALSRLTAGIFNECLIVNFPGSREACKQCFKVLDTLLEHALDQVRFDPKAVRKRHLAMDQTSSSNKKPATADVSKTRAQKKAAEAAVAQPVSKNDNNQKVPTKKKSDKQEPAPNPSTSKPQPKPKPKSGVYANFLQSLNQVEAKSPNSVEKRSPYPLLELTQALDIMGTLSAYLLNKRIDVHWTDFGQAYQNLGDVIAEDLRFGSCLPPYDVSTMDGYVVHITPRHRLSLSICGVGAKVVSSLEEFESCQQNNATESTFFCYQVNTGGRLPADNYAVVPVENVKMSADGTFITCKVIEFGKYVRKAGSDINAEDCIDRGTVITPIEIGLIMSMGRKRLSVFKRPSISILSTGDELVEYSASEEKSPDAVIDSNLPMLTALFQSKGFMVHSLGIARDQHDILACKIREGLLKSNIVIVTAGASMGSKDHVKEVISSLGGVIHFGRLNIKPGKPVSFASISTVQGTKFIFSLPGNPVSAYVTAMILVMPFINHGLHSHFDPNKPIALSSIGDLITVQISHITDVSCDSPYRLDGRLEFLRAKLLPHKSKDISNVHAASDSRKEIVNRASVSVNQQSSRLLSLKDFDCLILVDPAKKDTELKLGQLYRALRLHH